MGPWKKVCAAALHAAAAVLCLLLCCYADQGANPEKPETITVVSDDNYPPYIFRDSAGKLQGIIVDQWDLWEKETGIRVNIVGMDWGKAQQFMADGKADVIDTMFFTSERAERYEFSKPYVTIQVPIFFNKNITGISGPDSLRGFTVGVKEGDACIQILKSHGIVTLRVYSSYEEIIKAAAAKEIRVFCMDEPPALYYLYKYNTENEYRHSSKPLYTGQFHRAVSKGRRDLLTVIEEGFSKIPENKYAEIDKKWMGSFVGANFAYMRYVLYASMGAVLLVFILALWNYSLRKRVALKTSQLRLTVDALRESEEEYRELVENANSIILRMDNLGKVTFFNEFAQTFFGYSEKEILGKNVVGTIVPPVEATGRDLRSMIEDIALKPDCYVSNIYENMLRNGERVWIAWTNKPMRYENGGVVEVLCVGNDITERKRAEEALREGERSYREIFNSANDAIFVHDADTGALLDVNDSMLHLYGFSREEALKVSPDDSSLGASPYSAAEARHWITKAIAEGPQVFEWNARKKSGELFWVEVSLKSANIGGQKRILAVVRDITERRRAEDEILKAKRDWEDTFDAIPDMIAILDKDYRIVRANRAMAGKIGRTPQESVGLTCYQVVHGTSTPPAFCPNKRLLADGREHTAELHEERLCSNFSVSVSPLFGSDGELVGSVHVCRDITESKRAEEERTRLEERLQRAEKMEALGTLAGGVAHDLNNVLGIVVGYSELLLCDLNASGSAGSQAMEILKGGQRAAAIVQDLLTLARRGIQDRKVVNFNKILLESQKSPEFAKVFLDHPDIVIKSDFDADLLNVSGSSVHLEKCFMNLVYNAAEAMPGGGSLTIMTRNKYLDKPVSGYDEVKEGDYVVISVSDTGQGIPAADIKRIFEPFYTKKVMGRSGTGLGLAIVWSTVKDHCGYINVESEVGKGTIFTLYFPVTREDITPEVSMSVSEYVGNGESILIVDDVKEQRELAAAMLTKLNYRTTTVQSGEEAVEYLKQHTADLIVLDMIMDPGMDGLDTYSGIVEIHPHQNAIIVSGFAETERVGKAQALGAGAYVKKPYVLEKLGLAVRKELDLPK